MLKNYFKLAYRNLLNNKVVAFINIFGLSIAIATSITVFLYLQNEWTMNDFHENGDRIFMVEYEVAYNKETQIWGNVPMPLGPALADDFPQIEQFARFDSWSSRVYFEDRFFDELVYFADPSYFDLFTFPLDQGTPQVLNEPDAIIISTDLAKKYFQEQNPIGEVLTVVLSNQEKRGYTIKGVAAPFPENAGFKFDILAGMNAYKSISEVGMNDWANHTSGTFIQLQEAADVELIAAKMEKYVSIQNEANKDLKIQSFVFDNLTHPNPKAHEIINRPSQATHPMVVFLFALLAPLMMALSCFNYINIALGLAGKRLKEIGIRKAIGGRKIQLVAQFMTENLLLCFLALLLGLAIAQQVLIPLFNASQLHQIPFSFSDTPSLWVFLIGLLGFVAIASGAYPAFYISSFQPTAIFKGSQRIIKKNKLTQLFLGIQFILAFGIVITAVVMLSMGKKWMNLDWGYQPDATFMVRLDNAEQYDILKNEVERIPYVQKVAGSINHVGESYSRAKIEIGERVTKVVPFKVGADYFETLGLQIRQGRFFDTKRPIADAQAVVINQTLADQQAWKNPIGKTIQQEGQRYKVIGIVENFKVTGQSKEFPVAMFLGDQEAYRYMAIRHSEGAGEQIEALVRKKWATLYSDIPLHCFHQKLVFDNFYRSVEKSYTTFSYIAGLALLIACMGLFGLSIQNYTRFLKEASIRKVLGASVTQVLLLANRKFISLLVITSIIATCICWGATQMMLITFKENIGELQLGITPFLIANLLVFITACITISGQSYKLSKVTPADALRVE